MPDGSVSSAALYIREPFITGFTLLASEPAIASNDPILPNLAQALFDANHDLHAVVIAPNDGLLRAALSRAGSGETVILVAVPDEDNGNPPALIALVTKRKDNESHRHIVSKITTALPRVRNVLTVYQLLRRSEVARVLFTTQMRDYATTSLLSALVPDAFDDTRPLMATCTVVEGRAELGNRVIFERAVSAVSPSVVAREVEYQTALWSLGAERAFIGLGSSGPPEYLFGRISMSGPVGLFGFTSEFGPADSAIDAEPLHALAAVASAQGPRLTPGQILDADAELRHSAASLLPALKIQLAKHVTSRPDRISTSMASSNAALSPTFCVASTRIRPTICAWKGAGTSARDAFTILVNSEHKLPEPCSPGAEWVNAVERELSDKCRTVALMRLLSVLVEASAANGREPNEYSICAGQIGRRDGGLGWEMGVHGDFFPDQGNVLLKWTDERCFLEVNGHDVTLQTQWRMTERYSPLAAFSLPSTTASNSIEGFELRYLPPRKNVVVPFSYPSPSDATDDAWEFAQRDVLIKASDTASPLVRPAVAALVGTPLPYRGSSTHLDGVEWCLGSGPRRFAIIGLQSTDGHSVEAQTALQLLESLQEGAAPRLRDTTADIDRVLIGHLQHDLATLRAGFLAIEGAATALPSSGPIDRDGLRRTIRDVEDKLNGLETICSLYSALEVGALLTLDSLEGSIPLAIRRGASRACKKLGLNETEEERLAAVVGYAPPPPSRNLPAPHGIAVLLLENVLGNAICASQRMQGTPSPFGGPLVMVERKEQDEALIVKNIGLAHEWQFAKQQLRDAAPASRGLSLILQASRICGIRIVAGDGESAVAEVHLIPQGSRQ